MGDNQLLQYCGDRLCPCQDGDACHYAGPRPMLLDVVVHEVNLRALRCVLTNHTSVTLHHCHGGSMKEAGWHVGVSQKQNPFLQIPLHAEYHTGNYGIDRIGVQSWEAAFGAQVDLLAVLNGRLPYDIYEQAVLWETLNRGQTASRSTAIERLREMALSLTAPVRPTAGES